MPALPYIITVALLTIVAICLLIARRMARNANRKDHTKIFNNTNN